MSAPLLNATCRFTEPLRSVNTTDKQTRDHELHDHTTEYRCSVWDLKEHAALTVTGKVGVQALGLHVRTRAVRPRPGWIVNVKREGEDDFAEYRVVTAKQGSKLLPMRLTLEGV